jgi:hypothetical protein
MKNLTLIMAILLAFATTGIILLSFTVLEANGNNLALICMFSLIGYFGSYMYFDSYTDIVKKEAFMAGYDAGSTDQYI